MKPQTKTNIRKLHDLGQRIWLDNIAREMPNNGTLARYIAELSVTGLLSNSTIFEHAIGSGDLCDAAIQKLAAQGRQARGRLEPPRVKAHYLLPLDLMVLQPPSEHPHGLADHELNALFTTDKPVIFACHGYPAIIHKLTCRRHNHANIHVRGYKEEVTTTPPFDMVVLNNLDRYQLALDAIQRVPRLAGRVEAETARFDATMQRHKRYIGEHGDDMPEILNWRWPL